MCYFVDQSQITVHGSQIGASAQQLQQQGEPDAAEALLDSCGLQYAREVGPPAPCSHIGNGFSIPCRLQTSDRVLHVCRHRWLDFISLLIQTSSQSIAFI